MESLRCKASLVHTHRQSRVKAVCRLALREVGRRVCFPVCKDNDVGATPARTVTGFQIPHAEPEPLSGVRLRASAGHACGRPSGPRVEYRIPCPKADHAGHRETSLVFDIGQEAQDARVRAEVPILFRIRPWSSAKRACPRLPGRGHTGICRARSSIG